MARRIYRRFERGRSSIDISDRALAKNVADYGILPYLEKPISLVLSAWNRLCAFLPRADAIQLRSDLKGELKSASELSDRGVEP